MMNATQELNAIADALRANFSRLSIEAPSSSMPERIAIQNAAGKIVALIWLGSSTRENAVHVFGTRANAIAPYVGRATERVLRIN